MPMPRSLLDLPQTPHVHALLHPKQHPSNSSWKHDAVRAANYVTIFFVFFFLVDVVASLTSAW